MLKSATLCQIWQVIEQIQAQIILKLSDSELVQKIMEQLKSTLTLNTSEFNAVQGYVRLKVPLIRDLAEARQV